MYQSVWKQLFFAPLIDFSWQGPPPVQTEQWQYETIVYSYLEQSDGGRAGCCDDHHLCIGYDSDLC